MGIPLLACPYSPALVGVYGVCGSNVSTSLSGRVLQRKVHKRSARFYCIGVGLICSFPATHCSSHLISFMFKLKVGPLQHCEAFIHRFACCSGREHLIQQISNGTTRATMNDIRLPEVLEWPSSVVTSRRSTIACTRTFACTRTCKLFHLTHSHRAYLVSPIVQY